MHDGGVRFGVGLSTIADPRHAAADAATLAGQRLRGEPATFAVLLTSPHYRDEADAVLAVVHETAAPTALIGCVAEGIVAGRREVEQQPAVTVWLASMAEPVETFHLEFVRTPSGGLFVGYEFGHAGGDFHLLLPDPYSFPADLLLAHLNANRPGITVLGGVVSGTSGPGGCRLFRDTEVLDSGAVGARLPGWRGVTVVSQGCAPIGDPYTVTGATGNVLTELGGRPPLDRLREIIAALPPRQRDIAVHGPQLGITHSPTSVATPRAHSCSPATAAAAGCSTRPTTTRASSPTCSAFPWPGSSPPVNWARSVAATPCTVSPRPSPCSSTNTHPRLDGPLKSVDRGGFWLRRGGRCRSGGRRVRSDGEDVDG